MASPPLLGATAGGIARSPWAAVAAGTKGDTARSPRAAVAAGGHAPSHSSFSKAPGLRADPIPTSGRGRAGALHLGADIHTCCGWLPAWGLCEITCPLHGSPSSPGHLSDSLNPAASPPNPSNSAYSGRGASPDRSPPSRGGALIARLHQGAVPPKALLPLTIPDSCSEMGDAPECSPSHGHA